ncbi:MAG: ribosome biogenesis GTPase YlqF [Clostridiales bacterium]|nr:ribosome biogenesis GTPase YlqF [Clostridiales bacterium]
MHINWYPGHMKKTKELIQANLKLVDVVVELLDARIPISSRNPQIDELVGNKPRVVLLNKYDLCDQRIMKDWILYFKSKGIVAIPINSITGDGVKNLLKQVKIETKPLVDKMISQGRVPRAIRMMIVGIPNVGKSSLINNLVGKKSARTGNKPGVTKGKQWIRVRDDIELFDTPGILWPKIDDQITGLNLAFTGAINDDTLVIEDIGFFLVKRLMFTYPETMKKRYQLDMDFDDVEPIEVVDAIAAHKNYFDRSKDVDYNRVAKLIINDFRSGRLGHITLERPEEVEGRFNG